jgi:hypothetical protein
MAVTLRLEGSFQFASLIPLPSKGVDDRRTTIPLPLTGRG